MPFDPSVFNPLNQQRASMLDRYVQALQAKGLINENKLFQEEQSAKGALGELYEGLVDDNGVLDEAAFELAISTDPRTSKFAPQLLFDKYRADTQQMAALNQKLAASQAKAGILAGQLQPLVEKQDLTFQDVVGAAGDYVARLTADGIPGVEEQTDIMLSALAKLPDDPEQLRHALTGVLQQQLSAEDMLKRVQGEMLELKDGSIANVGFDSDGKMVMLDQLTADELGFGGEDAGFTAADASQIRALTEAGMDPRRARAFAGGAIKMLTNPSTGSLYEYDATTGQMVRLKPGEVNLLQQAGVTPEVGDPSMFEGVDAGPSGVGGDDDFDPSFGLPTQFDFDMEQAIFPLAEPYEELEKDLDELWGSVTSGELDQQQAIDAQEQLIQDFKDEYGVDDEVMDARARRSQEMREIAEYDATAQTPSGQSPSGRPEPTREEITRTQLDMPEDFERAMGLPGSLRRFGAFIQGFSGQETDMAKINSRVKRMNSTLESLRRRDFEGRIYADMQTKLENLNIKLGAGGTRDDNFARASEAVNVLENIYERAENVAANENDQYDANEMGEANELLDQLEQDLPYWRALAEDLQFQVEPGLDGDKEQRLKQIFTRGS